MIRERHDPGALGLRLDEAVQPADGHGEPVRTGVQVLRPRLLRGPAGGITMGNIPRDELRSAALALARLHTSAVGPTEKPPRTGAQEAQRACKRAQVIAACYPAEAQAALQLARQLAAHLERMHPEVYRPAHGGFKPSQLLFQGSAGSEITVWSCTPRNAWANDRYWWIPS